VFGLALGSVGPFWRREILTGDICNGMLPRPGDDDSPTGTSEPLWCNGMRWLEPGVPAIDPGPPEPGSIIGATAARLDPGQTKETPMPSPPSPATRLALYSTVVAAFSMGGASLAAAQPATTPAIGAPPANETVTCPDRNILYWQAFPPGGESDLSARHQQLVLKKKCPGIDTIIQYRAGAGGAVLWNQMNSMPADGQNVMGINLPHIVFQPIDGQVQYKTQDIVPVYWFHYTPDTLVVRAESPFRTFADFVAGAKAEPGKLTLGGSGQNSANHAAHERLDQAFGIKTTYVPYKGTGDLALAVLGNHINGAMTYTPFAIANKDKVRPLAVAMEARHPLLPDVPTFKELGVDWVDGAYRGIGVPKSTPADARRRLSELFAALNADPEMKELAAKSGFELVNVGLADMDNFMRTRTKVYTEVGKRMGLGGAK
jgi:tripartite-type tricarboxylate transporter receptor subunit TctC